MQPAFNKRTKIWSHEITIFDFKMMMKSGLTFFILKFRDMNIKGKPLNHRAVLALQEGNELKLHTVIAVCLI